MDNEPVILLFSSVKTGVRSAAGKTGFTPQKYDLISNLNLKFRIY
jgi:hypothetical protein